MGELGFIQPAKLISSKDNTYLTGIVISFDTEMVAGGLISSTAVETVQTHWMQVILPLKNEIFITKGEDIDITIGYKRNSKNPGDIDITLAVNNGEKQIYTL